ncbi:hypothetical protein [Actinoplanes siamensis]|uniref:MFS transporter n=1 Tax=Actinoplanes siamensis TaxID=1223317 RepID=A0A919N341_9ACTN|nr:hypothetical protein [Actinoplanes siamensis]GIF03403.1 hypothetical protein Asi03nite_09410 [Actinoplanes siamensis]
MVTLIRRDRDFATFWAGHTISVFGSQVTAVALPLVAVLTRHAGPGAVVAIGTASYPPNLFVPLVAGQWLENRRRRRVMVVMDVIRAVLLAVVPVAWLLDAFASALVLFTGLPLLIAILPGRGVALAVELAAVRLLAGSGLGIANVLSLTLRQTGAQRGHGRVRGMPDEPKEPQ